MTWYEDEVKALEKKRTEYAEAPETIFYGSSSIRLWETLGADFKDYKPVNLGFGGSTLAACDWFFDRLVAPLKPKQIIFYAGENDLGDGRHPEEVFIFFQQFVARVKETFGEIPLAVLSIKPSVTRWGINDVIKYTNELLQPEIKKYPWITYVDVYSSMIDGGGSVKRNLFTEDGLHMGADGYAIWKAAVLNYLQNLH